MNSSTGTYQEEAFTMSVHGEDYYLEYYGNATMDTYDEYTQDELDSYVFYYKIATNIWKYVPGFLICIGTVGNTLCALVMTRPALRKSVSSLFFTVLAFVDTFCLFTGLLRYWVLGLNNHDVRNNSELSCRLHTFLVYWAADYAGWILVLVSAERCFAANFPHIYKQSCTRAKASVSLAVCGLLLAVVNCHFLFGLNLKATQANSTLPRHCIHKDITNYYHHNVFTWIDLIFFCLGPFFCILICNVSIIVKVFRSRSAAEQKMSSRLSSMTAILICVSFFYILSTFPVAVYLIYQNTWFSSDDIVFYAKMKVYWAVASILSYFNNSMNFFLYCLSGPRFRKELLRMFRRLKPSAFSQDSSGSGI